MYADAKRLGSHPEAVLDFVSDLVLTPEPRKTGFVLANLSIVLYALCQPREAGGAGMQPSMLALALTPAVFQLYSDSGTPASKSYHAEAQKMMEAFIMKCGQFFYSREYPEKARSTWVVFDQSTTESHQPVAAATDAGAASEPIKDVRVETNWKIASTQRRAAAQNQAVALTAAPKGKRLQLPSYVHARFPVSRPTCKDGAKVRLIDSHRADAISAELYGMRHLRMSELRAALIAMDFTKLEKEDLLSVWRTLPNSSERGHVNNYLKGEHPKYMGMSDPSVLGAVEVYFMHLMDIPRLKSRVGACLIGASVTPHLKAKLTERMDILRSACEELTYCQDFHDLLDALLSLSGSCQEEDPEGGGEVLKGDNQPAEKEADLFAILQAMEAKDANDPDASMLRDVIREMKASSNGGTSVPLLHQMPHLEQASQLQVGGSHDCEVKGFREILDKISSGLKTVKEEIVAATFDEAQKMISPQVMINFLERESAELKGLQAASEGVAAELQRLAVRYGEQCAGCDPTWLLSSVFRLANAFDKALAEEDAANKPEEHQPTVDEVATLPRRKPASQRLTKSSPAMLGVSAGGHSCGEASGVLSPLSSGDESYFNPLFQTEDAQEDKASHHSSPALLHRSRPLSRVATHQDNQTSTDDENAAGEEEAIEALDCGPQLADEPPHQVATSGLRHISAEELDAILDDGASRQHPLGSGGFGTVFRGMMDQAPVAVKLLDPGSLQGRREYHAEVELLAELRHRHIVTIYAACDARAGVVMELMEGGSLEDRLMKGDMPWQARLRALYEACVGLHVLHNQAPPILHRDFKPSNILLAKDGAAKLADVGLAKKLAPGGSRLITHSTLVGSLGFVDEHYRRTGEYRPASDVYAVGVSILMALLGRTDPSGIVEEVREAMLDSIEMELLDGRPATGEWDLNQAKVAMRLALACVQFTQGRRPTLEAIVKELEVFKYVAPQVKPAKRPAQVVDELLVCPLSGSVMTDPCMAEDGYTYERERIQKHIAVHATSPVTNDAMGPTLLPNQMLRRLIADR
eukprot:jgi/Tetstr1/464258/TSEL_009063.t1